MATKFFVVDGRDDAIVHRTDSEAEARHLRTTVLPLDHPDSELIEVVRVEPVAERAAERRVRAVARHVATNGVTACPPSHDADGVALRRRYRAKRTHSSTSTPRASVAKPGGVKPKSKGKTKMANDTQRLKIRVPLGDADHPSEEKGSHKIVRRQVHDLKGRKGNREGVANWRGTWFRLAEDSDSDEIFDCVGKAKAPTGTDDEKPKRKAAKKVTAKKTVAKKAPAKKAANGDGGGAQARRKSAKKSTGRKSRRAA